MGTTNVERQHHAWFALADAEHCRLLCCHLTEQGTQHVDEVARCENTLPEAEHARPMGQDGMTHDIEEEERRFGAQIVEWLRRKADEHKIDRLAILAPPRMLGVLRKASSGLLKGHLKELEGNLMRLEAGQLAQHPMIRDLMQEARLSGGCEATSHPSPGSKGAQWKRGEPVARVVRKAWRAGARIVGPAIAWGSGGRHGNKAGGPAGRAGRYRGDK